MRLFDPDLTKLSPEPWYFADVDKGGLEMLVFNRDDEDCPVLSPRVIGAEACDINWDFIALARVAFAAEMRRSKQGWRMYWDACALRYVFHRIPGDNPLPIAVQDEFNWQNPYLAWYEADEWYTINCEK